MKKIYIKPCVKVRAIDSESMMAASDPNTLNVTVEKNNPINSGSVDAKGNHFCDFSSESDKQSNIWDD